MSDGIQVQDGGQWHLNKNISLSHIISTIVIAAGLIGGYYHQNFRISVIEIQQLSVNERLLRILESQEKYDLRQDREIEVLQLEFKEGVDVLNQKLDALIERVLTRRE